MVPWKFHGEIPPGKFLLMVYYVKCHERVMSAK